MPCVPSSRKLISLMGAGAHTHWVEAGVPRRLVLPVQQSGSQASVALPTDPNRLPLGQLSALRDGRRHPVDRDRARLTINGALAIWVEGATVLLLGPSALPRRHQPTMRTFLFASLLATATATATAAAQTYTLSDFGSQCGGDLHGQVLTSHHTGTDLLLGITGAAPQALAILVIGHHAATPIHLPGSQCLLLVDPQGTMLTTTTAAGSAHFVFHVPPVVPITIDFQAVIVTHSTAHGLVAGSTDGVHLTGV